MRGNALGARAVIAGGGTGGHLYPGLALADALARRGVGITFVGTGSGIEARVVPRTGYALRLLAGRPLRGGGIGGAVRGSAALARGVVGALGLLGEVRPGLVVGVGGYASVAVCVAAVLRRVPLVVLEQNVVPGAANRLLGRLARRVCVGFAETVAAFPPGRAVHTGNPVRAAVLRAAAGAAGAASGDGRVRLLVFGGSAGAHRLNAAVLDAVGAGLLGGSLAVTHQTGAADLEAARAAWAAAGHAARVEPFIDDMGAAYAAADLVVARAGAMTCSELTAVGLPSVLVPYPHAADDHQRRNAEVLAGAGAAVVVPDHELSGARLAGAVGALASDPVARGRMAARARALGRPDAAERVAGECLGALAGAGAVPPVAPT